MQIDAGRSRPGKKPVARAREGVMLPKARKHPGKGMGKPSAGAGIEGGDGKRKTRLMIAGEAAINRAMYTSHQLISEDALTSNPEQVLAAVCERGGPHLIVQDNVARAVMMDMATYEESQRWLDALRLLVEGAGMLEWGRRLGFG